MRRLEANTKDKDLNLLVIGAFLTLILVLTPSSAVFAQSPWGLFQKLCPSGLLATGPQCANLFTGNNMGTCDNAFLVSIGVCISSSTNTCPTNTVLQNGVCVPISSTCPIGTVLQNGVCVPFLNPIQSAPVANSGPSQTVSPGSQVTLNGAGSFATSGATIVSYSWVQTSGPLVALSGANTVTPTFTAPSFSTSLTFSLTVTDSNGAISSPSSVTITVSGSPIRTLPVANAGSDQTVPQGSTVTLDGTGSFARGGATIVSYSWVQTSEPFVTLNGPNTATPTFQAPTVSTSISLTFSLRVTDSNGLVSAPDSVTINVHP